MRQSAADKTLPASVVFFESCALMPLRPLRYQGIGERDENAAADIADEIDESRHLVVLLRRNSEIGSRGHGNKDKGDGDDLHHTQLGGKTEADEQADVLGGVEIPDARR